MSFSKPTYYSKLYRDFKAIDPGLPREIIRFYDENERAILELEFEEYFDLLVAYVNALFESGKYRQHLLMVDQVIESTIQRNIYSYDDQDLFFEMLSCKALSFFHICEYEKAEDIFRQLIRIKPERLESVKNLEKSFRDRGSSVQHWTRAVSIGMLFLAAILIGIEILLIRPFYEMYVVHFEFARTATFVLSCIILAAGECIHRVQSKQKARLFLDHVREKKV